MDLEIGGVLDMELEAGIGGPTLDSGSSTSTIDAAQATANVTTVDTNNSAAGTDNSTTTNDPTNMNDATLDILTATDSRDDSAATDTTDTLISMDGETDVGFEDTAMVTDDAAATSTADSTAADSSTDVPEKHHVNSAHFRYNSKQWRCQNQTANDNVDTTQIATDNSTKALGIIDWCSCN
ncbi:hypothetical protein M422DRAFT_48274 [Sphaerobolus stellatus SS14]|uniref:Uncharacterized protein n=1 Tax=Sphaerobolus stellatus (strain SS14) TaxID=990650 RepID=A0A0C9VKK8_SPHS4|nr:hypothetical protein M422DRAFT_48274 [Sphaerobolus stellatus SS14]